jgi:hypothetical protein
LSLDIEDRDVKKTEIEFRPIDATQPCGVVMDGGGTIRVCGNGITQRHGPRIDGQLLKNGSGPIAGKAKEDPKKNDKPISY